VPQCERQVREVRHRRRHACELSRNGRWRPVDGDGVYSATTACLTLNEREKHTLLLCTYMVIPSLARGRAALYLCDDTAFLLAFGLQWLRDLPDMETLENAGLAGRAAVHGKQLSVSVDSDDK